MDRANHGQTIWVWKPWTVLTIPVQAWKKKKKTLSTFYRLTEVDLHYCSFKHAVRHWDLRLHHSFFSFFFSILLSLVFFSVSVFFVFSSLVISAFLPSLSSSLLFIFLVFTFSYTQPDCQAQPLFLGIDFNPVDKTMSSFFTFLDF